MKQPGALATVIFTDIVGFKALKERDEGQAMGLFHKNELIQKNAIHQYHGEFLKNIDDEITASFKSPLHAVQCAIAIQQSAIKAGYFLRIGIHVGEFRYENDEPRGESVRLAVQLQKIAAKGTILISEQAYHSVKNNKKIALEEWPGTILESKKGPLKVFKINYPDSSHEISRIQVKTGKKAWLPFMILGIVLVIFLIIRFFIKYR